MNNGKHTFIGGNRLFAIIIFNAKHRWIIIIRTKKCFSYFFSSFCRNWYWKDSTNQYNSSFFLSISLPLIAREKKEKNRKLNENCIASQSHHISYRIAVVHFDFGVIHTVFEHWIVIIAQTTWNCGNAARENRKKMSQHFRIDRDFRGLVYFSLYDISKFARYLTHLFVSANENACVYVCVFFNLFFPSH